jgi:hypothetical protein
VKAIDNSENDCRWTLPFSEVSGHSTEGSWCGKPPVGKGGNDGAPLSLVGNGGSAGGKDPRARLLPVELFLLILPISGLPVGDLLIGDLLLGDPVDF